MPSAQGKRCASCGDRYDGDVLFCPRDGTPLASSKSHASNPFDSDPYIGLKLQGNITVRELIGIGSMGRVYRAWQSGIERDVAVKVLHRELSSNAELVTRFHREAKVASRIVHPNVVQVLMTGAIPKEDDRGGELYLVMEYLNGISLLSALAAAGGADADGGALPLGRALHIVLALCDAVGEAHAQGIVHRDLKPENVMLVKRGDDSDYVKVLDFGIARLERRVDFSEPAGTATQAGLIFGSARYISPEGAEGLPVGSPADVYAIATILYQCLAGRTPFEGESSVALLVQHTHAPPTELRSIARASYVPPPIGAMIMQNLAKNPADRAENGRALGRDLVCAIRASGLSVEDLVSPGSLMGSGRGPLQLPSQQRTKSLPLSSELAARLAAVNPSSRPSTVANHGSRSERQESPSSSRNAAALAHRASSDSRRGELEIDDSDDAEDDLATTSSRKRARPSGSPGARVAATVLDDPDDSQSGSQPGVRSGRASAPPSSRVNGSRRGAKGVGPPSSQSRSRQRANGAGDGARDVARSGKPDHHGASHAANGHATPAGHTTEIGLDPDASWAGARSDLTTEISDPSTMQGHEAPIYRGNAESDSIPPAPNRQAHARRSRVARAVAIAIVGTTVVLLAFLGGRKLGNDGSAGEQDPVDAIVGSTRDAIRRKSYVGQGGSVRDLLRDAGARYPDDPRVQELSREASERALAEAVGKRYAGETQQALELARLSLELAPELVAAQRLVGELEGEATPVAIEPAATGSAGPDRPKSSTPSNSSAKTKPPKTPASAAASTEPPPPKTPPTSSSKTEPTLPPIPPALPEDHVPPPAVSTGGKWM